MFKVFFWGMEKLSTLNLFISTLLVINKNVCKADFWLVVIYLVLWINESDRGHHKEKLSDSIN